MRQPLCFFYTIKALQSVCSHDCSCSVVVGRGVNGTVLLSNFKIGGSDYRLFTYEFERTSVRGCFMFDNMREKVFIFSSIFCEKSYLNLIRVIILKSPV